MGMSATNKSLPVHTVKQKVVGQPTHTLIPISMCPSTTKRVASFVVRHMSHVNVQRGIETVTGVV